MFSEKMHYVIVKVKGNHRIYSSYFLHFIYISYFNSCKQNLPTVHVIIGLELKVSFNNI